MIPDHYFFDTFRGKRLHLGVTGSIAAYKALDLTRAFLRLHIQVGATLTEAARRFVTPLSFQALGADPVHTELFPETTQYEHLEPGIADTFLVVPATANILAKMTHGLADNLLSCQLLAYPGPIVVAPAMNPRMWTAAPTAANWSTLLRRGVHGVHPDSGLVACGDTGQGKLAPIDEIFIHTLRAMTPRDLHGKRILLTMGPTREYFDRARFWSNPSTGTMGACLAICAALRGAQVTVVHGPVNIKLPRFLRAVPVLSAQDMHAAVNDLFPEHDIACCTAAVADFRPPRCPQGKFKKSAEPLQLVFEPNPDILAGLGERKNSGQFLIGFAAEIENLASNAAAKLSRKHLDLIVANPLDDPEAGFATATNRVRVLDRHGRDETWPVLPKTEVAWRIWDWTLSNMA